MNSSFNSRKGAVLRILYAWSFFWRAGVGFVSLVILVRGRPSQPSGTHQCTAISKMIFLTTRAEAVSIMWSWGGFRWGDHSSRILVLVRKLC